MYYYDKFHKYVDKNVSLTKYGITELSSRKKDIAWMVSHCITHSKREEYVNEMEKFKLLQVDIYGECGNLSQPSRAKGKDLFDRKHNPSNRHCIHMF